MPLIGVILGTAGTLLSVWSLAFFFAPNAVPPMPSVASLASLIEPVVSTPDTPPQANAASAAPAAAPLATTPLAAAAPTSEETHSDMQMAAGTIAFVLESLRTPGQAWPAALFIDSENMVSTAEGNMLARIPAGTTATYTRTTSEDNFRLIITDDATGTVVTFDSTTGVVTN
ncbi:hypothetical protein [Cryobacterium sp. Hb1]|uniref:hypothetical protein n=1 Tax=Cryobacterium sp. Hb1 TaxID=1259147 RepID=UPI00106A859D|nr:hypothetical protein [Cryobacterium sp. Hb1]TFD63727.1 hypothetical protein E3T38_16235 [Cryobacterium sp. Hb1]